MAVKSINVGIEKLDKDNFQPWKFRIRNYLMVKDLQGYVTGEYKELELSRGDVSAKELKAWKTWNEKDKKVMFLISQNVSNGMIGYIQNVGATKEAWDTLEKLYHTNTKPSSM